MHSIIPMTTPITIRITISERMFGRQNSVKKSFRRRTKTDDRVRVFQESN